MILSNNKLVMTVEEAGQKLGVSRAHAYKMAKEGLLPVLHLGRRAVVPIVALDKMLEAVKPQRSVGLTTTEKTS